MIDEIDSTQSPLWNTLQDLPFLTDQWHQLPECPLPSDTTGEFELITVWGQRVFATYVPHVRDGWMGWQVSGKVEEPDRTKYSGGVFEHFKVGAWRRSTQ